MLSDLDRQILTIEDGYWHYAGRKDAAIMGLGINAVQYAAALSRLVRDPDAERENPVLIKRLQRRIDAGMAQRNWARGTAGG